MAIDIVELNQFYASPLGLVARRVLRRRLREMWPTSAGHDVLGLGYATPYLRPFREEAQRVVALMPAAQGVVHWPEEGASLVGLAEETELPLPDASFSRVLAIHALEHSEQVRPMLREIWRVLAPEGRLLLVVPHRRSPWSSIERTPFGHGHPYSSAQIARLLSDSLFAPGKPVGALFFPPFAWRFMIRQAAWWESVGKTLWPGLSGVILVEATKRIYAATKVGARRRAFAVVPARAGTSPATSPLAQAPLDL